MASTIPSAPPPSYEATREADSLNKTGNANVAPYPPNQGYGMPQPQYPGHPAPQPGYGASYPPPQPHNTAYPPPNTQGYNQPYYQEENAEAANAFNANSFSDKAIRRKFIMKVYLILMCQLLFTCLITAVFVLVDPVRKWVQTHAWFYYLAYATFFVTYIALACCPSVRRKFPGNYIALFVFTVMFSYVCGTIASFHKAEAVLIAAGITALVAFSISMFAIQTKIDFTMCYGLMFAASMVLLFMALAFIIIVAIIPPGEDGRNRYYLQIVYGSIAALILCLFLVFDTQRIVGGKNRKNPVGPEEHILGAMELYLDIVYLFLIILSCFGGKN